MQRIGIDIIKIERIEEITQTSPAAIARMFTELERKEAKERKKGETAYYATRFTAKEAVYKALNIPLDAKGDLKELEILNDENGRPYVVFHGNMKVTAQQLGVLNMDVSISYENEYAVAIALAVYS